jgi:hypothetical protein
MHKIYFLDLYYIVVKKKMLINYVMILLKIQLLNGNNLYKFLNLFKLNLKKY